MPKTSKGSSNQSNKVKPIQSPTPPELMAPRPCDRCRKHRIKCDRNSIQCNHCKRKGLDCTYLIVPKKRGPKSRVDAAVEYYQSMSTEVNSNDNPLHYLTNQNMIESNRLPQYCDSSIQFAHSTTVPVSPFEYNWLQQPLYTPNPLNLGMYPTHMPIYMNQMPQTLTQRHDMYGSYFPNWDLYMNQKKIPTTPAEMTTDFTFSQNVDYDQLSSELIINYANLSFTDASDSSSPVVGFSPILL